MGALYAMIGIGLTIVFGVMRIINLAHGEMVMLGMFGAFWSQKLWGFDPFLSILIWAPVMFLLGVLVYRFLLRKIIPGGELNTLLYTAGFSLLVANLALMLWTGDYRTISLDYAITPMPPLHLFGVTVNWESKAPFYFVAFALMALSMAAVALLARSRLGAFLVAIRENEEAAEAVGIDTVRAKVLTLALSGFLAGTGGGFYAFYFRYVDPDAVLNLGISMEMVFIAMVGGLGTVAGPLIGAVFLTTVGEAVRERFQVGHLIFYGLFMMLVIRFLPEGIWGRVRKMSARIGAREVRHGAPGG